MEREWSGNVTAAESSGPCDDRATDPGRRDVRDGSGGGWAVRRSRSSGSWPLTGGLKRRMKAALAAAAVAGGAGRDLAGPGRGRFPSSDREAPGARAFDDLEGGRLERVASSVSGLAGRRGAIERGRRPKPCKLALDARLCREVERGLREFGLRNRSRRGCFVTILTTWTCAFARDDLPHAVRPGSRGAAQGAHGLPSDGRAQRRPQHADSSTPAPGRLRNIDSHQ